MQDESKTNEEIEEIGEELDFNKPAYTFIPKGMHEWRQEGSYLVCGSCDLTHAVWIGNQKMLIGMNNDGSPMIVTRKDYEKYGYKKAKERLQGNR